MATLQNARLVGQGVAYLDRLFDQARKLNGDPNGVDASRVDVATNKARAEGSLIEFVRLMWTVLEPSHPFLDGWAIRAICEHLEAITHGRLRNLLINCPPGFSKSSLCNVFWPAWEWGPVNRPSTRILSVSHSDELAIRDNLKCRRLIQSPQYQALWGDRFQLTGDQNTKGKFENDRTGFKMVSHVGGAGGSRGDRIVIDDPHEMSKANSDAYRETARTWFTEVVPTRISDPEKSSIVVIMQRLHQDDISGLILEHGLPFEHLVLPMHYEENRKYKPSTIGWTDPRTKEGELAWPERFSAVYLKKTLIPFLSTTGGEFGPASQLQQRPVPRGGGSFKVDKLCVVDAGPEQGTVVRGWDLAASTDRNAAWTVGVKLLLSQDRKLVYVLDVVRRQCDAHEVERLLRQTTERDGHSVVQHVPQDPGQAGKAQVSAFAALLAGYRVSFSPETGDKVQRAQPFAAQVNAGNVRLVRAPAWNDAFVAELSMFPMSRWKDQVDAASRAYAALIPATRAPTPIVGPVMVMR